MGFLQKWFPEKEIEVNGEKAISNKAITYIFSSNQEETKKERLILNIKELSKKKRITKDISAFRTHLKRWQHYNEDRDFMGDYAAQLIFGYIKSSLPILHNFIVF